MKVCMCLVQISINEAARDWGLQCLRYEIRDISPPRGVRAAMEMQAEAERKRRAQVLESEGERQANINITDGKKSSVILASEAAKMDQVNRAQVLLDPFFFFLLYVQEVSFSLKVEVAMQSHRTHNVQTVIQNMLHGDPKIWAKRLWSYPLHYIPGVVNPHAKVVQNWNKFFIISCSFAVLLNPFFFFLLYVQELLEKVTN
ncbi:hypothetical protein ACS0TY_036032 [Phlomoides rotata]